jgi:hypothetical protein
VVAGLKLPGDPPGIHESVGSNFPIEGRTRTDIPLLVNES